MGSSFAKELPGTRGSLTPPTFDPLYGFPNGRKERVMIATDEEMRAAKLSLIQRDYCAHLLIDLKKCRKIMWPQPWKCHHEKHIYDTCEFEDQVLRMKEFERERRLLEREKRKQMKAERYSA